MSIDRFRSRLRPPGLLYVDVYPYHLSPSGELEFLLLKRRGDIVLPNVWQPVSGKIKEGEKFGEAFIRQAAQKTGRRPLRVFALDTVNTYFDAYYDTVMLVPSAACRLFDKTVALDADLHVEFRWVDLARFEAIVKFDHQRETARKISAIVLEQPGRGHYSEIPVS
ncbi:MAG: NUDIX domain-containing protein [Rhodospirillales bacterium]|nr:NUDIX domain-containing protein [Rhodospirillales bacterium]